MAIVKLLLAKFSLFSLRTKFGVAIMALLAGTLSWYFVKDKFGSGDTPKRPPASVAENDKKSDKDKAPASNDQPEPKKDGLFSGGSLSNNLAQGDAANSGTSGAGAAKNGAGGDALAGNSAFGGSSTTGDDRYGTGRYGSSTTGTGNSGANPNDYGYGNYDRSNTNTGTAAGTDNSIAGGNSSGASANGTPGNDAASTNGLTNGGGGSNGGGNGGLANNSVPDRYASGSQANSSAGDDRYSSSGSSGSQSGAPRSFPANDKPGTNYDPFANSTFGRTGTGGGQPTAQLDRSTNSLDSAANQNSTTPADAAKNGGLGFRSASDPWGNAAGSAPVNSNTASSNAGTSSPNAFNNGQNNSSRVAPDPVYPTRPAASNRDDNAETVSAGGNRRMAPINSTSHADPPETQSAAGTGLAGTGTTDTANTAAPPNNTIQPNNTPPQNSLAGQSSTAGAFRDVTGKGAAASGISTNPGTSLPRTTPDPFDRYNSKASSTNPPANAPQSTWPQSTGPQTALPTTPQSATRQSSTPQSNVPQQTAQQETVGQPSGSSAAPPVVDPPAQPREFTAGAEDSFWTIARQAYGSGGYYQALHAYNSQQFVRMEDLRVGDRVTAPPVSELRLRYPDLCPAEENPPPAVATPPAGAAPQTMPDGRRAENSPTNANGELASNNDHNSAADKVDNSADIRDENLRPASTTQPIAKQPPKTPPANAVRYTTRQGDDLFKIARDQLGATARWNEIYELNRDTLGQRFEDLPAGMTLLLPERNGGNK